MPIELCNLKDKLGAPQKALPSLPFEAEEPLKVKIEGDALIIPKV